MATQDKLLDISESVYEALLSLYPDRFRHRFRREMTQVFRDCCLIEIGRGRPAEFMSFCLRTLKDLLFSLMREWRKEPRFTDSAVDMTGLVDAFVVSFVVGTNLLGWGWIGATIALNLTLPRLLSYRNWVAIVLAGVVTISLAALVGILSALAVRSNRTERTRLKV
jgi:hypothetical protein